MGELTLEVIINDQPRSSIRIRVMAAGRPRLDEASSSSKYIERGHDTDERIWMPRIDDEQRSLIQPAQDFRNRIVRTGNIRWLQKSVIVAERVCNTGSETRLYSIAVRASDFDQALVVVDHD
jgi:hypothetical protein